MGDVTAGGEGSDIRLFGDNSITIGGKLTADQDIEVGAGNTVLDDEVSVNLWATTKITSTGGDGFIDIHGVNDVVINARVGCQSVDLTGINLESTDGNLYLMKESGRVETDAALTISAAKNIDLQGVIDSDLTDGDLNTLEVDIEAGDTLNFTGSFAAEGSARFAGTNQLNLVNTVKSDGAGEKSSCRVRWRYYSGGIGVDDSGVLFQMGALFAASGRVEVDAEENSS